MIFHEHLHVSHASFISAVYLRGPAHAQCRDILPNKGGVMNIGGPGESGNEVHTLRMRSVATRARDILMKGHGLKREESTN